MGQGDGVYPETDPWGGEFKDRWRASLAGQRIAGQYVSVLEGIQGDQDFIRILFNPSRSMEISSQLFVSAKTNPI